MNKVNILDCTLRDGGYCNQWDFKYENIKKIILNLTDSEIEIIECGFLTNKVVYNKDKTKFSKIEDIIGVLPKRKNKTKFVCMINFGEYDIDELPDCNNVINGIRIAFHKKDINAAMDFALQIKNKGYMVFLQPMVSLGYSDTEFLDLIQKTNKLSPYAFYIVDSFGAMKRKDLLRMFYMVDNNLNKDIYIGYHSHNNMQLAYSNAQTLTETVSNRKLIIDTSILGMGRGAGNLNTELFVEYVNECMEANYKLKPLLHIIDEIISTFYQKKYWGYSLPNYLSAKHNLHPNYAMYLNDKKTLTVDNMDDIFHMFDDDKKVYYDQSYIEKLYVQYMSKNGVYNERHMELKNRLKNKKILIIAPGKSSLSEKENIQRFIDDNVISISVNFDYKEVDTDYIFVSNIRRFKEISKECYDKCIITSNITSTETYMKVNYFDLLNDVNYVRDNAGMMLIKYLIKLEIKDIYLAGFDGYSMNYYENYNEDVTECAVDTLFIKNTNNGLQQVIKEFSEKANITFLTKTKYILK